MDRHLLRQLLNPLLHLHFSILQKPHFLITRKYLSGKRKALYYFLLSDVNFHGFLPWNLKRNKWRRGRDSNPRYLAVHSISNAARSATLSPLRVLKCSLDLMASCVQFVNDQKFQMLELFQFIRAFLSGLFFEVCLF